MVSINDITVKREILYSLAPFSEGLKNLKRKSDLIDFAFSDLRLYGSTLAKAGTELIIDGVTVQDIPVFEHRLCEAHRKLLARFESKLDMGLEVDIILLNEFCSILSGTDLPPFREDSPLLYHLNFVAGDDKNISADMDDMFFAIKQDEKAGAFDERFDGDFCLKAARIHNGIVSVYPYSNGFSELSARAAMQYVLLKEGFFPVDIGISETEYNTITTSGIQSGDAAELSGIIRTAIYKKLQYLIDAATRGV
jgi:hypothetical protein